MTKMSVDETITELTKRASFTGDASVTRAIELLTEFKSVQRNYARLRDAVEKAQPHFDQMADRVYAPWCKIQDRFQRAMAEQPTSFDTEQPPTMMTVKDAVNIIRAYAEADIGEHGTIEVGSWSGADALQVLVADPSNQRLRDAIARLDGTGIRPADVYTNQVDVRQAGAFAETIAALVTQADRVE